MSISTLIAPLNRPTATKSPRHAASAVLKATCCFALRRPAHANIGVSQEEEVLRVQIRECDVV